jgi:hypothetical protein
MVYMLAAMRSQFDQLLSEDPSSPVDRMKE